MRPSPSRIHLDLSGAVVVDEPARAEAILRAVQEIITNTTRHAHACNLWIRLDVQPHGTSCTRVTTAAARTEYRGDTG